ncbi:Pirin cupin domain-containing protein [Cladophialophora immunda]|nr:Pirin cupin domain-containing protein [Cladophialophora immunda]
MKQIYSLITITTALLIAYYSSTLASSKTLLQQARPVFSDILHRINPTTTAKSTTTPFLGLPLIPSRLASTTTANMTTPRQIKFSFLAREQSEGAGAVVRRSVGTPKLRHFTPFLMLDHFRISPGAGFPDHPHRGQETITYLLQGGVNHEDFAGNAGKIGPGDLQFMTAGRGIVHAEMPVQTEDLSVGMQLWVDLPENLKSCEPRYRDLRAEEIPIAKTEDGKVEVKVISGKSEGVESLKDLAYTPVWLLDISIQPGGKITQEIPHGWNAFAYTLEGAATFSNGSDAHKAETITPYHNVVFEQAGDVVTASVEEGAQEGARFILVAGQPLDQNIVQYGPFVTTSKEAIYQAMMDFQTSSNGFERAANWESEIGKSMGRVR